MHDSRLQQVVRAPRHGAAGENACRVWVELASRNPPVRREAVLVNLSRSGLQLSLDAPLAPNEPLVVHIQDDEGTLDVVLPAKVRWQRSGGAGLWSLGCLLDELVGYEVMGELFLRGILDMGPEEG